MIQSIRPMRWKKLFMLGQIGNTITRPIGRRMYSVTEVWTILGISRRKVYELCNSGNLRLSALEELWGLKYPFDYWTDHFEDNGGIENGINRQKRLNIFYVYYEEKVKTDIRFEL